jgi:hypothetical protein
VGVDNFWKRVSADAIVGREAKELSELMPYWSDDQYKADRAAGTIVGAEDTGALIDVLLASAATTDAERAAAAAFRQQPADWDDDYMVGSIDVETVRQVAALLADAPLAQWVSAHHDALARGAEDLGYRRPFDAIWAQRLLEDATELAALFHAASTNNQAVVIAIIA